MKPSHHILLSQSSLGTLDLLLRSTPFSQQTHLPSQRRQFRSPLLLATASHSRIHLVPTYHHARLILAVPTWLVLLSSTLQPLISPPPSTTALPPIQLPPIISILDRGRYFCLTHSIAAMSPSQQNKPSHKPTIRLQGVRSETIPFNDLKPSRHELYCSEIILCAHIAPEPWNFFINEHETQ